MNNLLSGDDTVSIDPDKDYYEELVGTGKKFQDQKALARGKFEADMHIKTLEIKMDQLRADYLKEREENVAKAKLEELRDQILNHKVSNEPVNTDPKKPEMDLDLIDTRVSERYKALREQDKEQENFEFVKDKLTKRFGSNYKNQIKDTIQELDLTEDEVNSMARRRPKALLKALGADEQPQQRPGYEAPPKTSSGFAPKPLQKRTWAYYQDLKTKKPNLYYDPKINIQMQKDHIALGAEFEDGDFHAYG